MLDFLDVGEAGDVVQVDDVVAVELSDAQLVDVALLLEPLEIPAIVEQVPLRLEIVFVQPDQGVVPVGVLSRQLADEESGEVGVVAVEVAAGLADGFLAHGTNRFVESRLGERSPPY